MATKAKKPIGSVTHFFGGIGVVIIKLASTLEVGTRIHFKGATTDFEHTISSMQFDHKEIEKGKKGQEVGVKVEEKAREGDVNPGVMPKTWELKIDHERPRRIIVGKDWRGNVGDPYIYLMYTLTNPGTKDLTVKPSAELRTERGEVYETYSIRALRAIEAKERKIAHDKLTALVDRMKRKYPEAGLSLGYLGNYTTGPARDDTTWYVFSQLAKPGSGGHKSYSWGGYPGADNGVVKLWNWAKSNLDKVVAEAVANNDGPYLGPAPWPRRWASTENTMSSINRVAENWIGPAIKEPGRLHKHFGIPEDKTIPMSKIKGEIAKLEKKEKRTKDETSLLRALNMAVTLKSKTAKNLPPNVERYVQEGLDQGLSESEAWGVAWSRYCKYKNPGSPHCKKDKSDYFPGRSASDDPELLRRLAKLASGDETLRGHLMPLLREAAAKHIPGEVWQTPQGLWRAMRPDGKSKSFRKRPQAEEFAAGKGKAKAEKDKQQAKVEKAKEKAKQKAKAEKAEAEKADKTRAEKKDKKTKEKAEKKATLVRLARLARARPDLRPQIMPILRASQQ